MMTFQIKFYQTKIQLMEREQHELYEYARRLKQKKLYLHFVLLFLASLFLFVSNFFILD
jgi:hypothetical protein